MTTSPQAWFMGGVGASLLKGGVPNAQDGPVDLEPFARSNPLAVAGIGGEAVYSNVYLAIEHVNPTAWTFTLVPVVDRVQLAPIAVELDGVVLATSEILEVSLMQEFSVAGTVRSTYAPRGQWFQLLLFAADAPDGLVSFDGIEVEYEIEVEGQGAVNG